MPQHLTMSHGKPIKSQHVVNNLALFLLKGTGLYSLTHYPGDFLLRHDGIRSRLNLNAEDSEDQFSGIAGVHKPAAKQTSTGRSSVGTREEIVSVCGIDA
ncbi:MAG: hypothetical protein ACAI35_26350 [Candidatus Methylacidiphilales bacterium]